MSLFRWQEKRTRRDGVEKLLKEVELPLSHVLFRMEEAGFTVDGDALRALGQGYTAEIEACREQVYQAAGVRDFNLNSTQQLGEVLFDRLQLPHGKKTQKGYSTSAEVLEKLRTSPRRSSTRCCATASSPSSTAPISRACCA